MILQKVVGNIYSVVVEIMLWLIPIIGFFSLPFATDGGFHIGWAILGLLGGIILDVILFGPIIIILNMRSSLKNIESK